MHLQIIMDELERIAPLKYAEDWDNVGLLAGDVQQKITGVMLCIDLNPEIIQEAQTLQCNLIIAYHPPIFKPVTRLIANHVVYTAIQKGLAIYSPHTALDYASGGINDALADMLQLHDRQPLRFNNLDETNIGTGRIGDLKTATSVTAIINRIKQQLHLQHVLIAGPIDKTISRVACLGGAGGDFIDEIIAQGAELFLTGEIRHHDALKAANAGLTVISTLHSNSERLVLPVVKQKLSALCQNLKILISKWDKDPMRVM